VLSRAGKTIVIAHVAQRLDIIDRETRRAQTILIYAAIVACMAVVLASLFIARSLVDPIVRLTGAMEEIGSEKLDRRLRWKRSDEIGRWPRPSMRCSIGCKMHLRGNVNSFPTPRTSSRRR